MFKVKRSNSKPERAPSNALRLAKRQQLVREAITLAAKLEAVKPMYSRMDELLAVLSPSDFNGSGYALADKFGDKNSAWKSVCFRRFELTRSGK